jgi:hypothetical protein
MSIDLKEILQTIHSGQWFACSVIQANQHKRTGGHLMHIKRCRLARRQPAEFERHTKEAGASAKKRNPNHSYWFTRNVELPGNNIITIHPLLIVTLNNRPAV